MAAASAIAVVAVFALHALIHVYWASGGRTGKIAAVFALAAGLLLRAVGDFRLVGFFTRTRGTVFARLDTPVFSPLCLVLSFGVFHVALSSAA